MKMRVKVDDRTFDVEIESLSARPIVATVDGEVFEIWPEEERALQPAPPPAAAPPPAPAVAEPRRSRRTSGEEAVAPERAGRAVFAPIPGVIQSVAVRPGDAVAAGQELCVLEAMKMKNIIRAPRPGTLTGVHVSAGQHVKHNDLLVEYG